MRLFACEFVPIAKTISKARSVVDTSTKNFVMWKTSVGIFPRAIIQHPISDAVKCRAGNCRAHGAEIFALLQIFARSPQYLALRAPDSRGEPSHSADFCRPPNSSLLYK